MILNVTQVGEEFRAGLIEQPGSFQVAETPELAVYLWLIYYGSLLGVEVAISTFYPTEQQRAVLNSM